MRPVVGRAQGFGGRTLGRLSSAAAAPPSGGVTPRFWWQFWWQFCLIHACLGASTKVAIRPLTCANAFWWTPVDTPRGIC